MEKNQLLNELVSNYSFAQAKRQVINLEGFDSVLFHKENRSILLLVSIEIKLVTTSIVADLPQMIRENQTILEKGFPTYLIVNPTTSDVTVFRLRIDPLRSSLLNIK